MTAELPAGPGMRARWLVAAPLLAVTLLWPLLYLAVLLHVRRAAGEPTPGTAPLWVVGGAVAFALLATAVSRRTPALWWKIGLVPGIPAAVFGSILVTDSPGALGLLPAHPIALAVAGMVFALVTGGLATRAMTGPVSRDRIDAGHAVDIRMRGAGNGSLTFAGRWVLLVAPVTPDVRRGRFRLPSTARVGWTAVASVRAGTQQEPDRWAPGPNHDIALTPGPVLRIRLADGQEWVVPVVDAERAATIVEYARRRWSSGRAPSPAVAVPAGSPVVHGAEPTSGALPAPPARQPTSGARSAPSARPARGLVRTTSGVPQRVQRFYLTLATLACAAFGVTAAVPWLYDDWSPYYLIGAVPCLAIAVVGLRLLRRPPPPPARPAHRYPPAAPPR